MDKPHQIIHAAIDVFKAKGIMKATVSDIVKRAGIAQGTYYLYFPSKLAVMSGIAGIFVSKQLAAIERHTAGRPFASQLDACIHAILEVTREEADIALMLYTGLTQTQDVKRWEEIYEPLYRWLEKWLLEAKESGIVRSDLHPWFTAKILLSSIESTAEQIYLYSTEDPQVQQQLTRELHLFIHGAIGLRATQQHRLQE